MDARDIMQKRLRNIAASEAKIDTAALFGYGSDGKQVQMLLARWSILCN